MRALTIAQGPFHVGPQPETLMLPAGGQLPPRVTPETEQAVSPVKVWPATVTAAGPQV